MTMPTTINASVTDMQSAVSHHHWSKCNPVHLGPYDWLSRFEDTNILPLSFFSNNVRSGALADVVPGCMLLNVRH